MAIKTLPAVFSQLQADHCIASADVLNTDDDFFMVYKSLAGILFEKGILDFPDSAGEKLLCERFFDDWFLYAVPRESDFTYGLLKLREQEHDAEDGAPADGDTPGVTISFVSFDYKALLGCLADPNDENRGKLNREINRVVAHRGQRHHKALKKYFKNPQSKGAYLVARVYTQHMASFAIDGRLALPEQYKAILQQSISYKKSAKFARLPAFIAALNQEAGRVICDSEYIYINDPKDLSDHESAVIMATHTGNTSVYSFAAEVEYHARFLTSLAKIKIPFFGRSIYDSAIRADMTVGDTEFEGPAPFYQADSKIVKRQYALHGDK